MKRIILGMVLGFTLVEGAFAECTYNFDATEIELQNMLPAAQPALRKFPFLSQSTASFTLEQDPYQFYASSHAFAAEAKKFLVNQEENLIGDKVIDNSGKYAVELKINDFADIPNGTYIGTKSGVYLNGFYFYGMKNTKIVYIGTVWVANSDNDKTKKIIVNIYDLISKSQIPATFDIPYTTQNNFRLGLYFNQDSKRLGLNINGVDKGYLGQVPMGDTATEIAFQLFALSGGYPSTLPKTYKPSSTLIADANQMTLTYPTGAKDICGNTI